MNKIKKFGASFMAIAMLLASGLLVANISLAKNGLDDSNSNANKNTNSSSNTNVNSNTNNSDIDSDLEDDKKNEDSDEQEIDDQDGVSGRKPCINSLINGHLYKIGTDATVYMSSHCVLKPFRGEAVFKTRGLKFEGITTLPAVPADVTVSTSPVLPADGTLIKGRDKTVWFVDNNGHRRGFVSAEVFKALGFTFEKVKEISDTDLAEIPTDTNVADDTKHPDGALIKCTNSSNVFIVIKHKRFPFANAEAFKSRGHAFEHILNVDCSKFVYPEGAVIAQ